MRRFLVYAVLATLGVSLPIVSGCASTPPTRLYILPSLVGPDTTPGASAPKRDLTVGVGPVTLPPIWIGRRLSCERVGPSSLSPSSINGPPHYRMPLPGCWRRTSLLIPTDHVVLAPWPRTTAIDYQVLVEVTRFDGSVGGEVVLAARWSIAGADGKELIMRQSRLTAPAGGQEYEAIVTAMGRTLEALSREITAILLSLVPQPTAR